MARVKKPHLETPEEKMKYKERKRNLGFFGFFIIFLISLLGGLFGGILGFRYVLPEIAGLPFFDSIYDGDKQQVTIERTETVRVEEPLRFTDTISKIRPSLVMIYRKDSFVEIAQNVGEYSNGENGFVLTSDGMIVSQASKFENFDDLVVVLENDTVLPVDSYFVDEKYDLAFIKVSADNLTPVDNSDFESILPGERSLVFDGRGGYIDSFISERFGSYEFSQTTFSDVFTLTRYPQAERVNGLVVGFDAKAIGFLVSRQVGDELQNMVVSMDLVKRISNLEVVEQKTKKRDLGFLYRELDSHFSSINTLPKQNGVFVYEILNNALALEVGDLLLSVNGVEINQENSFEEILWSQPVDEAVVFTLLRNGDQIEVDL